MIKRPQVYLDATEEARTDATGSKMLHEFSDGTRSATKSVICIHPLRFAIENCGGEMTALLLAYGSDDLFHTKFPSNGLSPLSTACDWASQNKAALGSLSALLEWAWRDIDPDEGISPPI